VTHLGRSNLMPETPRKPSPQPHDVLAAEEFVVPAPDPGLHGDKPHDILAAEEFVVPAADPGLHRDEPHDVLAAEEFVVPAADPGLHRDEPHDVLAAEEFELGAADPALHHGPVTPPPDLSGIEGPHDVLAAEEFAVPAGPAVVSSGHGSWTAVATRGPRVSGVARAACAGLLLLGAVVAIVWRRRHA
jgi:hypothetical protein